jgi:hypothetical protein
MNVREYSAILQVIIHDCPLVIHWSMEFDEITLQVGYFKGMLEFIGGSTLYFIEFVDTSEAEAVKRLKYKYHWQSESGELIARWDNVPHHRDFKYNNGRFRGIVSLSHLFNFFYILSHY